MRGLIALAVTLFASTAASAQDNTWPGGISYHDAIEGGPGVHAPAGYAVLEDSYGNPFFVRRTPAISPTDFQCVGVATGWNGEAAFGGQLTEGGRQKFSIYTRDHVGQPFAIMLNGRLLAAPTISSQIEGAAFVLDQDPEEIEALIASVRSSSAIPRCPD